MNYQDYDEIFERDNYPKFREIGKKSGWVSSVYSIMPEDYGRCLCMSGNKFKFCCKDKIISTYKEILNGKRIVQRDEMYNSKPKRQLSRKIEKTSILKKNISFCFAGKCFNNCDTLNHIRKSHTMAESNVFKNLSGSFVIGFDDHMMEDEVNVHNVESYFRDVSINDASATVSFCKVHDEYLFDEIEQTGKATYKNQYIENLEYALKAATYDVYFRIMRIKYLSSLFNEYIECADDRFMTDYKENVDVLFNIYTQANRILHDIKSYKTSGIVSTEFYTTTIKLPIGKINYSLSECITYKGIQCFMNVVNIPEPYVILSYYNNEEIPDFEIKRREFETDFFGNIIDFLDLTLVTTQNVYFNKDAYSRLSNEARYHLYLLHRFDEAINYLYSNEKVKEELKKELFVV